MIIHTLLTGIHQYDKKYSPKYESELFCKVAFYMSKIDGLIRQRLRFHL